MSKPHLVLTDVHRHYGQGDKMVRVLEAANLTVESGEMVALVAPSGAGKSTLLHLSGLLESPQGGEIEIIGIKTSKLGDRGRTQLRRSTVGYVYQFHHLLPEFTALENVSIPQLIAGKSQAEADKRSMELLDLLGVAIFPPEVFFLAALPSKTDPVEVTVVVCLSLGLSFLATLYPAWRAAQYDPVEALRYE